MAKFKPAAMNFELSLVDLLEIANRYLTNRGVKPTKGFTPFV